MLCLAQQKRARAKRLWPLLLDYAALRGRVVAAQNGSLQVRSGLTIFAVRPMGHSPAGSETRPRDFRQDLRRLHCRWRGIPRPKASRLLHVVREHVCTSARRSKRRFALAVKRFAIGITEAKRKRIAVANRFDGRNEVVAGALCPRWCRHEKQQAKQRHPLADAESRQRTIRAFTQRTSL